jgi:hypothetical protein
MIRALADKSGGVEIVVTMSREQYLVYQLLSTLGQDVTGRNGHKPKPKRKAPVQKRKPVKAAKRKRRDWGPIVAKRNATMARNREQAQAAQMETGT